MPEVYLSLEKLGKNIKRGELIPPINLDKETIDRNSAERR
jgi:hypothetical protein